MSVDVHPTDHRDDTVAPPAVTKHGPVGRIVAGSLAAGFTAALVLALVVFAGGTESVITGALLTGFGFGWALITVLTMRFTTRPQRWASVPAAVMGFTGLALLAFTPGYEAMTRLGWVWPPLVLAMSVWTFVQIRRNLTGAGRWMLIPVVTVLGLASVGATYENFAERSDQGTYAAPGTTYEVNGHRLHLDCQGHGGPTVVLINGMGEISASWARIAGRVEQTTRVCAYDRAGQGWSKDAKAPQDGVAAAEDLHALLATAGEAGPFVLVGHSTGGTYAMIYAAKHPEQVAGMVLLDSSSPYQLTKIPAYAGQYAVMRRGFALLPTLARLGLSRLAPAPHLPGEAGPEVQALTSTARAARNGRDEVSVVLDVFAQAQALTTLQDRPLAVVTASESLDGAGWAGAQDQLAALSTNQVHRTVHSSHPGLLVDKTPAAASVRAVEEVVSAVRTGTPMEQNEHSPHSAPPTDPNPTQPEEPRCHTPPTPPDHSAPRQRRHRRQRPQEVLGAARSRPGRSDPGRARHLGRQHRPALHRPGTAPPGQPAGLAGHRLPDDVRRLPAPRRSHRRPPLPPPRVPDRAEPVHPRLPGQRVRREQQPAHRCPRRPGTQRRTAHPLGALADHDHLRRSPAQDRTCHVGCRGQPRRRSRSPPRRSPDHLGKLASHLLDQRADRYRGAAGRAPRRSPRTPRLDPVSETSTSPAPRPSSGVSQLSSTGSAAPPPTAGPPCTPSSRWSSQLPSSVAS